MIYGLVLCFVAGAALEGYSAWKRKLRREVAVQVGLVAVGILFAIMYNADVNWQGFPLAVLEPIFQPLTRWLYDIL